MQSISSSRISKLLVLVHNYNLSYMDSKQLDYIASYVNLETRIQTRTGCSNNCRTIMYVIDRVQHTYVLSCQCGNIDMVATDTCGFVT